MRKILFVIIIILGACLSSYVLFSWPLWLGTLAAWVTSGSFLLQVIHIFKNKDTKGLSLGMWGALFFGVTCWASYGFKMNDAPVLIANTITAVLSLTVIALKLWHERPKVTGSRRVLIKTHRVILKPRIKALKPIMYFPISEKRKMKR